MRLIRLLCLSLCFVLPMACCENKQPSSGQYGTVEKAKEMGRKASKVGLCSNEYSIINEPELWHAWNEGWMDAKLDKK